MNTWCDDDRRTPVNMGGVCRGMEEHVHDLGNICKQIQIDINKQKWHLLWNETEYTELYYENNMMVTFGISDDWLQSMDENPLSSASEDIADTVVDTDVANPEVLDTLTKNAFAST